MLTLEMPQSEPVADRNASAALRLVVKIADDRPCGTSFCIAMASSSFEYFITYRIGAKVSVCTTSALLSRPVISVGSTKLPLRSVSALPPLATVPPARSEEHPSELQSLMPNSYDVFCLKKKKNQRDKTP